MKKVLLITPEFFQYYKYIKKELEAQGCEVTWFRDIPSTSTLTRGLARLNKKLIEPQVSSHLKQIVTVAKKENFDKLILVYGMTFSFSPNMIKELISALPNASRTLYLWDSVKNLPRSKEIIECFDSIYSFDKPDCLGKVKFLPLFYTEKYSKIANSKAEIEYFCSYIGTAHPNKFKCISEMSLKLKEKYPEQFIYHYIPSKFKYYYHKIKDSEYKHVHLSDLTTEKVSVNEIADILSRSVCVLDAPQVGQTGLTMRTLETLGAKKKLITANETIKDYDFYNPTNIYVYTTGEDFDFLSDFFTKPYEELPEEIYEKYSLKSWISTLLK